MRAVIDASVALKWVVPESGWEAARALRSSSDLCAPDLLVPELTNALSRKVSAGELATAEAGEALALLMEAGVRLFATTALVAEAFASAVRLHHPAYDCFYLALAIRENCPMVTADARFVAKLRATAPSPAWTGLVRLLGEVAS